MNELEFAAAKAHGLAQARRVRKAFGILLDGYNTLEQSAMTQGRGLGITTEYGLIEDECKGLLRVIDEALLIAEQSEVSAHPARAERTTKE